MSRSVRGYTLIYAALEQIYGHGTDARSDLYSLGATLYHLLTGVAPIDAPTGIVNLKRSSRILPRHVGDCAFLSATNGGHFPGLHLS
jgi:serine/threonine protein kinase